MRIKKVLLLSLAIVLIMIGACGCMNGEKDYQTPIQDYLKDKYGCEFSVKMVDKSVGTDGPYVRAVCESADFPGNAFEVECYPGDSGKTGDEITLGEETYFVFDTYSDIVFSRHLEKELEEVIDEDAFVRCTVLMSHGTQYPYSLTKEQYAAGMKACLEQPDVYSFVSAYIVVGATADLEKIQSAVEAYALNNDAYSQHLYFAVMPELMEELVARHYEEHKGSFAAHMGVCELILQMESVELRRGNGVIGRIAEKG